MPKSSAKPKMPAFDFFLHLMVKFPVVLVSEFLLPCAILAGLFFALRGFGLLTASVYFGKAAFALLLLICILFALRSNSKVLIYALWRERKTIGLFHLPHPLVADQRPGESLLTRVKRLCAIATIEAKSYTIAYGVMFIVLYFPLLYFLRGYDPASMECKHSCEVFRFGLASIASGPIFDFFEAFHVPLSDIENGSLYFLTAAYLAKLVFVGLVVRIVTLYFGFRKRFASVLRQEALKYDDPAVQESLRKLDPAILGPKRAYMLIPPWLRRRRRTPAG